MNEVGRSRAVQSRQVDSRQEARPGCAQPGASSTVLLRRGLQDTVSPLSMALCLRLVRRTLTLTKLHILASELAWSPHARPSVWRSSSPAPLLVVAFHEGQSDASL